MHTLLGPSFSASVIAEAYCISWDMPIARKIKAESCEGVNNLLSVGGTGVDSLVLAAEAALLAFLAFAAVDLLFLLDILYSTRSFVIESMGICGCWVQQILQSVKPMNTVRFEKE